jgi:protein-disulfide isomerase
VKRLLPFIIVALVAIGTLAGAAMLYVAMRPPSLTISEEKDTAEAAAGTHIRGPANAPVTLEEFGDFQCPPCGKLAEPIGQIEKDYGQRLRVIFRHFPFAIHQHGLDAAFAAEAAGLQNRFWEMHDVLYREQAAWSNAPDVHLLFNAYAGMLGLNIERFKKDLESEQVKERVVHDQQRGKSVGVSSTPTIFINNHMVPATSLNPAGLRAAIDAAIEPKPAP